MKEIIPWLHLSDILRISKQRFRIFLDKIPSAFDKAEAKCMTGSGRTSFIDPATLLDTEKNLSAWQIEAIKIILKGAKGNQGYWIDNLQFTDLCYLAHEVPIEVANYGVLILSSNLASISLHITHHAETSYQLSFHALDSQGNKIEQPKIFGRYETLLLAKNHIYPLNARLGPKEASALLGSQNLDLQGLHNEEAQKVLHYLISAGINVDALKHYTHGDPDSHIIVLRIILDDAENQPRLRLHLVSIINHQDISEEHEIASSGNLSPVIIINSNTSQSKPEMMLLNTPFEKEHEARRSLINIGAVPSARHNGFEVDSKQTLSVLASILSRTKLPDFIHLETDALPTIQKLALKPTLHLTNKKETSTTTQTLVAQISCGLKHIPFAEVQTAVLAKQEAFIYQHDTIVTFNAAGAKTLIELSEILELSNESDMRQISIVEAALLVHTFKNLVILDCPFELKQQLDAFTGERTQYDYVLPAALQTTLRPYQHDAVAWLSQLHRAGLGRLLADDMGLGKTLMVLVLLAKVKEQEPISPSLIIAPTSVIDVWTEEAQKHVPGISVHKWHGATRLEALKELESADLVVTSYGLLRRDVDDIFSKINFNYLILDEAQFVKNLRTESWRVAKRINCNQRIALTGTPIENSVEDLYSIIELVAPGALGTEKAFQKRYANPIARGESSRIDELKRRVSPILLRRSKQEVETDLPPKIENILRCEMNSEQKMLYQEVLNSIKTDLQHIVSAGTRNSAQIQMLAALTRLRQICCDPSILRPHIPHKVASAKGALLQEVVNDCLASGRRIIIFSQFVSMQKIIIELLKEIGLNDTLWLHGGTKDRAQIVSQFQQPNGPKVIVVSLKAGGTGLTLTAADTVIFYDPWWNPAVEDQAADRAHRIGQTKAVHVIRLICNESIEEQVLALASKKREDAGRLLGTGASAVQSLSLADIEKLLSYELKRIK